VTAGSRINLLIAAALCCIVGLYGIAAAMFRRGDAGGFRPGVRLLYSCPG
jgi:hypothetical protein